MGAAYIVVLRCGHSRMQEDDIGFIKKQNPGFAVAKPG